MNYGKQAWNNRCLHICDNAHARIAGNQSDQKMDFFLSNQALSSISDGILKSAKRACLILKFYTPKISNRGF